MTWTHCVCFQLIRAVPGHLQTSDNVADKNKEIIQYVQTPTDCTSNGLTIALNLLSSGLAHVFWNHFTHISRNKK